MATSTEIISAAAYVEGVLTGGDWAKPTLQRAAKDLRTLIAAARAHVRTMQAEPTNQATDAPYSFWLGRAGVDAKVEQALADIRNSWSPDWPITRTGIQGNGDVR